MSDTNGEQAQGQVKLVAHLEADMFSNGQITMTVPKDLKLAMNMVANLSKYLAQRMVQEDWVPKAQGGKIIVPHLDTRGLDLGGN